MNIKEIIALLRFLQDQYGDDTEVTFDWQGDAIGLAGGFRVEIAAPRANSGETHSTRTVVLL